MRSPLVHLEDTPSTRRAARWLWWSIAALVGLAAVAEVVDHLIGSTATGALATALDLRTETALGTWVAAVLALVAGSGALALGAQPGRRERWGYVVAGAVLVAASAEEVADLHGDLSRHLRGDGDRTGLFAHPWVVAGAVVAVVVGVVLLPWWRRLPTSVREGTALGAALYVTGALVAELPEGYLADGTLAKILLNVGQELLELLGLAAVAVSFLAELERTGAGVHLGEVRSAPAARVSSARRR